MDPVTLALAKSWAEGQFGDLRQLQQHIAALQTVSGLAPVAGELQTVSELAQITDDLQAASALAPYVQTILDSRIVEMGSNSNGEYVRWENGLQVCYGTRAFTANTNGDTTVNVTFPAAFAAPGSVLGVLEGPYFTPSGRAEWVLRNPGTQGFGLHLIGLASSSCAIQFCAIGRWK